MICEKIPFSIDVERLSNQVQEITSRFPPVMMSHKFGGWSITSSDGKYTDGWISKEFISPEARNLDELLIENKERLSFKGARHYRQPTELCVGYIGEILELIEAKGLFPCRARLMLLKPGGSSAWHRDYPDWMYGVRLHIPVITNEQCLFETEEGSIHLPADGSTFLLKVNRMHRILNKGLSDRIHLICDAFDTKQVSLHHQFTKADLDLYSKFIFP